MPTRRSEQAPRIDFQVPRNVFPVPSNVFNVVYVALGATFIADGGFELLPPPFISPIVLALSQCVLRGIIGMLAVISGCTAPDPDYTNGFPKRLAYYSLGAGSILHTADQIIDLCLADIREDHSTPIIVFSALGLDLVTSLMLFHDLLCRDRYNADLAQRQLHTIRKLLERLLMAGLAVSFTMSFILETCMMFSPQAASSYKSVRAIARSVCGVSVATGPIWEKIADKLYGLCFAPSRKPATAPMLDSEANDPTIASLESPAQENRSYILEGTTIRNTV